ncbi:MAG: F0F1 ATP synthase subunit A [Candidatus Dormibacteraeota bacterium]|uniref:ATP synthase subunit a n=1 Tax=Candidatus Amunia macphersoniae TaxID=3127014 RepID=A0A934NAP9_9BACT|nr:F0F1 ATP synthase subunit A [Candidatus Dormibacteraeota bacterium]
MLAAEVSNEPLVHPLLGHGFIAINVDTARNSLIVAAILVIVGVVVRRQSRPGRPGGLQNLLEYFVDAIRGLVRQTLGDRPIRILPIVITMFAFIFLSNLIGLIPGFKSPTNDVNTTVALAFFAIGLVHVFSVRARGPVGYLKHYFSMVGNPIGRVLLGVLEIFQEFVKPFTLALRLYFNIFVGELLLAVILVLLGIASPIFNGLFWIPFSVFIGLIQAFIFVMLTISYINQGTDVHHDDAEEPSPSAAH